MEQQCSNCRYFHPKKGGSYNKCRFNPPVYVAGVEYPAGDMEGREGTWAGFVETSPSYWCGQWTAANPTTYDATLHRIAPEVVKGDLAAGMAMVDRLQELQQEGRSESGT